MPVRTFTQFEDEKIAIAREEFPLKALPSGKAVNLQEMTNSFGSISDKLFEGIDTDQTDAETMAAIAQKVMNSKFKIFAFALQIEEDSDDHKRLTKALDEASFPEIVWALDQILDVNGLKHVERLIKNLFSRLEPLVPDLREAITASLKRFSKNEDLMDRLQNLRSTGSTPSSQPSQDLPSSLEPVS